jgi:hypothetical protein
MVIFNSLVIVSSSILSSSVVSSRVRIKKEGVRNILCYYHIIIGTLANAGCIRERRLSKEEKFSTLHFEF